MLWVAKGVLSLAQGGAHAWLLQVGLVELSWARGEAGAKWHWVRTETQFWELGWEQDARGSMVCTHSGVRESQILGC